MASVELPPARRQEQEPKEERIHSHIRHLPEEVVAQIKSSTVINNLNDVISELVKNSLDANASKIAVSLDFRRASCTVEDNGIGIWPSDFTPTGGIGKLYHTSKYPKRTDAFGQNGSFLASLASLSLLTITSRHHQHQSVNSVILHNSRCISRFTPITAQVAPLLGQHGTTVSVRDLFGNMPVRVKQRAALEGRDELEKLCSTLKKEAIAIMLACGKNTEFSIRHVDIGLVLRFRKRPSPDSVPSISAEGHVHHSGVSASIQHSLSTLIDAAVLSNDCRRAWIPVSASTGVLKVKGAISSVPAPTKNAQFISLDRRPLTTMAGHNELFDEVNRIFSTSSFGVVDTTQEIDSPRKDPRKDDKSSGLNGPTMRDLKCASKGVDRWPMFFFHITTNEASSSLSTDGDFWVEPKLPAIIDILSAMVTQWLVSQDHRPRKRRRPERLSSDSSIGSAFAGTAQSMGRLLRSAPTRPGSGHSEVLPEPQQIHRSVRALNGSSRIKSGKPSFYESALTFSVPFHAPRPSPSTSKIPAITDDAPLSLVVAREQDKRATVSPTKHDPAEPSSYKESMEPPNITPSNDESMAWQDPLSRETYVINCRTGAMLLSPSTSAVTVGTSAGQASNFLRRNFSRLRSTASPRLADRDGSSESRTSSPGWLPSFLQAWENPIFQVPEKRIPQINIESTGQNQLITSCGKMARPSNAGTALRYEQLAANSSVKISRDSLLHASVVAQVDAKFILVRLPSTQRKSPATFNVDTGEHILVLIDQHAADERIKIESLLGELCSPSEGVQSMHRSSFDHAPRFQFTVLAKPIAFDVSGDELVLLKRYGPYFARWSILYTTVETTVKITALPSIVAERLRSSPQLLIDLLRSEVHTLDQGRRPTTSKPVSQSYDNVNERSTWLGIIDDCPVGLLDLVNSRACRSAVMFNDVLEIRQCQALLDGLARCVFPFMCAHGRPSMVPIVTLGTGVVPDTSTACHDGGSSFADAFRRWQAIDGNEANQNS